ncbi:exo-alpha-sialidase [Oleiharenicola lentus]|uniref:exo-alpha-sialidase n=1 Tax=Oleiharenicola lentus TaxID=2508720 RepID=UPI003F669DF5
MKVSFIFLSTMVMVGLAVPGHAGVEPTSPQRVLANEFGMQLRPPPARAADAWAPAIVREAPSNECSLLARQDGALEIYYITKPESETVSFLRSEDGGLTWSEPRLAFKLPGRAYYAVKVLEAPDGTLHAIFHVHGKGEGGHRGNLYEVYHVRRELGAAEWTPARRFVPGYVGSIRGFVQLPGGRLLAGVARAIPARGQAPASGPDFGWHDTYVYWSGDRGETWHESPDHLRIELTTKNTTRYGAIEPVLLPLADGRVWMLVRDRQGRLWQSFSNDRGERWSPVVPTDFISSDSPAELLRLRDGAIVLFSNPCQNWSNPRSYAMGGREVLTAGLSQDEGLTWKGFREILHETAAKAGGDRGTAYASAVETRDGKIAVVSGQGHGKRAIVLFDPRWLLERKVADDLGAGPIGWTSYGGSELQVVGEGAEATLSVGLKDKAGGALWNFPAAKGGLVQFHLQAPGTVRSLTISLTDHFNRLDDRQAAEHAVVTIPVDVSAFSAALGRGMDVRMSWRDAAGKGTVTVEIDGKVLGDFPLKRTAAHGINYLRVEFSSEVVTDAVTFSRLSAEVR